MHGTGTSLGGRMADDRPLFLANLLLLLPLLPDFLPEGKQQASTKTDPHLLLVKDAP